MVRFTCDYEEGCVPEILARLEETNLCQTPGYGEDEYCASARKKILSLLDCPAAQVHFLVGGTQTNATLLAAALRPHQGALCASTGHINIHETGAVEATGHKVLPLPSADGKISAEQVRQAYDAHWNDATHEHMVQPGLVYISHPTELGTLYTRAELEALRDVCRERGLYLYLDGARLGYGLEAPGTDVTLPVLADCCDAFYIGGTKVGAMFGEALVLVHPALQRDFRYLIKQHGGMFAKGRLLGIQFDTLFTEGLYFRVGRRGIETAMKLREGFRKLGAEFLVDSPTNQQFPILPDALLERLSEEFAYSYWQRMDGTHSAVRFCTSWATTDEQVDKLLTALRGERI